MNMSAEQSPSEAAMSAILPSSSLSNKRRLFAQCRKRAMSLADFNVFARSNRRRKNYEVKEEDDNKLTASTNVSAFGKRCFGVKKSLTKFDLVQRIFPTQFSIDNDTPETQENDLVKVSLNVYRINDQMGFYHTGIVIFNSEYTFCQDIGICRHTPMSVCFATYLGSTRLGYTSLNETAFEQIVNDMKKSGFNSPDYDVMENSCNSFTATLSKKLGLFDRYPAGVVNQSKVGEMLSPVARALDLLPDNSPDSWRRGSVLKGSMGSCHFGANQCDETDTDCE